MKRSGYYGRRQEHSLNARGIQTKDHQRYYKMAQGTRQIKKGDIISIDGEQGKYVVIEERGPRLLVEGLGTGMAIPPTRAIKREWVSRSYRPNIDKKKAEDMLLSEARELVNSDLLTYGPFKKALLTQNIDELIEISDELIGVDIIDPEYATDFIRALRDVKRYHGLNARGIKAKTMISPDGDAFEVDDPTLDETGRFKVPKGYWKEKTSKKISQWSKSKLKGFPSYYEPSDLKYKKGQTVYLHSWTGKYDRKGDMIYTSDPATIKDVYWDGNYTTYKLVEHPGGFYQHTINEKPVGE